MIKHSIFALSLLLALSPLPSQAKLYKWVDAAGNVHFSDQPTGSEAQRLDKDPPTSTDITKQTSSPKPDSQSTTEPEEKEPEEILRYDQFEIVSPLASEVADTPGGVLKVQLAIQPDLDYKHRIAVYINGIKLTDTGTVFGYDIPAIRPGRHRVGAEVLDQEGNVVEEAVEIIFTVGSR